MAKEKNVIKRGMLYTIDLTQIDGDGSIQCPKCGAVISPEDETEEVYKILDTKLGANDELAELVVECGTCGSVTRLTGFQQCIDGLANE